MISDTIRSQIQDAMKKRNLVRLETLKMLNAALVNAEITKKRARLTEDEELKVVYAEVRKREDAIEAYVKAGVYERAEKEKEELNILREFLPEELSDEALSQIVSKVIDSLGAKGMDSFGKVMAEVMKRVAGRADGKRVAEQVRARLV